MRKITIDYQTVQIEQARKEFSEIWVKHIFPRLKGLNPVEIPVAQNLCWHTYLATKYRLTD